jgi:hypothetical protein
MPNELLMRRLKFAKADLKEQTEVPSSSVISY